MPIDPELWTINGTRVRVIQSPHFDGPPAFLLLAEPRDDVSYVGVRLDELSLEQGCVLGTIDAATIRQRAIRLDADQYIILECRGVDIKGIGELQAACGARTRDRVCELRGPSRATCRLMSTGRPFTRLCPENAHARDQPGRRDEHDDLTEAHA